MIESNQMDLVPRRDLLDQVIVSLENAADRRVRHIVRQPEDLHSVGSVAARGGSSRQRIDILGKRRGRNQFPIAPAPRNPIKLLIRLDHPAEREPLVDHSLCIDTDLAS